MFEYRSLTLSRQLDKRRQRSGVLNVSGVRLEDDALKLGIGSTVISRRNRLPDIWEVISADYPDDGDK